MASLLRTDKEIQELYDRHVDTVYRVCYSFMKNKPEAEDMVQETFLHLITSGKIFENERHEKAWLIVTASNLCKDTLKKWWRRNENLDDHADILTDISQTDREVLDAVLALPEDQKCVVYLYYYEGYTTQEIARHLKCPSATVRSRLSRARKQLSLMLGGK